MNKKPKIVITNQEQTPVPQTAARSRFFATPGRRLKLTKRDIQVLLFIYKHGLARRDQLQELFGFGETPSYVNGRLRLYYDAGLVDRTFDLNAPHGTQAVYWIARGGVRLVARWTGFDLKAIRSHVDRHAAFSDHTLEVVDFRVHLGRALAAQADWKLDLWLAESECIHQYEVLEPGGGWRTRVMRPDAFFRIRQAGGSPDAPAFKSFFLEIDRSGTGHSRIILKFRIHADYLATGLFRETYGTGSFNTLVVTTSDTRRDNLVQALREQGSDLMWVTTREAILALGVLGRIWHAPAKPSPVALTETAIGGG